MFVVCGAWFVALREEGPAAAARSSARVTKVVLGTSFVTWAVEHPVSYEIVSDGPYPPEVGGHAEAGWNGAFDKLAALL